ncbi:MAG: transposase [Candidatus Latescibacteria bacterium]|nr:transposase [Candidatus Latescibacterota bacterium]
MSDAPGMHRRRSIRLPGYDYSRSGAYFVTICVHQRECLYGEVNDGAVLLNDYGQIAQEEWHRTSRMRPTVQADEFVIMPNHVHGIISLTDDESGDATTRRGTMHRAPTGVPAVERFGKPTSNTVPTIIRGYKSIVTNRVNRLRGTPGRRVWQRNYYEHVIRDQADLSTICHYIVDNPIRWEMDRYHPHRDD